MKEGGKPLAKVLFGGPTVLAFRGIDRTVAGIWRALQFTYYIIPIAFHYKWMQLWYELRGFGQDVLAAALQPLHNRYAPRCLQIALRMQGFYIKLGQHWATWGQNALPQIYVDEMSHLLENCPSQPFDVVRTIVEGELGPISRLFEHFEEQPLKAASTGQVHCARLHGGHEVVVKVQHPSAEWTFRTDLSWLIKLSEVLGTDGISIIKEIQKMFDDEFDYGREAKQQREAAECLGSFSKIVVPLPVDGLHPLSPTKVGLCSKNVLVMDRLHGKSLWDWGVEKLQAEATRRGKTVQEVRDELAQQSFEMPSKLKVSAYCVLKRGQSFAHNVLASAYNWSYGNAVGRPMGCAEPDPLPDLHDIVHHIMEAQGHMIFKHGFFNADPHAGNVMLLDDGRIGLIDWGQVARLSVEDRVLLGSLVVAVAERDDTRAAEFLCGLGTRTKRDLKYVHSTYAKMAFLPYTDSTVQAVGGPLRALEVLCTADPTVCDARNVFIMVFKNQLYVRQVAAMLGFPHTSSAEGLLSHARLFLRGARLPEPWTEPTTLPMPPAVQDVLKRLHLYRE